MECATPHSHINVPVKPTDVRLLNDDQQLAVRQRAIHMISQLGMKRSKVAVLLGVNYKSVVKWRKDFTQHGEAGLISKKRGTKGHALLELGEQAQIRELITRHTPDELGLPFVLWSREAVRRLIRERLNIKINVRTISDYLEKWGFSPQTARQTGSRAGRRGGSQVLRRDAAGRDRPSTTGGRLDLGAR